MKYVAPKVESRTAVTAVMRRVRNANRARGRSRGHNS